MKHCMEQVEALQDDLKSIEWDKRGAKYDLEIDRRRYESMRGISFTSIKTRLFGNYSAELSRLQQRYETKRANYDAVVNQSLLIKDQLQQAKKELDKLKKLNQEREKIKRWQNALLGEMTEGVQIKGEEELLEKISAVKQLFEPIARKYNSYRMAQKLLAEAKRDLQYSKEYLDTGRSHSGMDILSGNPFPDVAKHRSVSRAQKNAAKAMSKVAQAKSHVKTVSGITIPTISSSSHIVDVVFDDPIFDTVSRFQLNNAIDLVKDSFAQIDKNLNSLNNITNNLKEKYNELGEELQKLREQLFNLRSEYVEKQLK